jgi:hypothetical protein
MNDEARYLQVVWEFHRYCPIFIAGMPTLRSLVIMQLHKFSKRKVDTALVSVRLIYMHRIQNSNKRWY